MTVGDLLKSVRRRLRDAWPNVEQRLWEDAELIDDYANAARDRLFLTTRYMVIDSVTPEVCSIPIVAGTATYALSPKIIEVMRVKLASHSTPSVKMSVAQLDQMVPGWQGMTENMSWSAWCNDLTTDSITFVPVPQTNDTAQLTVSRYPVERLTSRDKGAALGFREEYHEDLIPWVLYLAFSKKDAETDRPDLAEYQRKLFLDRTSDIRLELHRRLSTQHSISPRRAFLSR